MLIRLKEKAKPFIPVRCGNLGTTKKTLGIGWDILLYQYSF